MWEASFGPFSSLCHSRPLPAGITSLEHMGNTPHKSGGLRPSLDLDRARLRSSSGHRYPEMDHTYSDIDELWVELGPTAAKLVPISTEHGPMFSNFAPVSTTDLA